MNKFKRHIGYIIKNNDFNRRFKRPFYKGLNIFTRIGNYFRDK